MKKIKTFEDACKALKISATLPDFSTWPDDLVAFATACYKLTIIARALNGKWKPDWNNTNQWKHYPWFYMGSAGAGFRLGVCVFGCDSSDVGSRLVFKDEKTAEYAATQFVDLYKDYMLTPA